MDVKSEVSATVWRIDVRAGERVVDGQTIMVLESMKMEIPVEAPCDGVVAQLRVTEGEAIEEDHVVAVVDRA